MREWLWTNLGKSMVHQTYMHHFKTGCQSPRGLKSWYAYMHVTLILQWRDGALSQRQSNELPLVRKRLEMKVRVPSWAAFMLATTWACASSGTLHCCYLSQSPTVCSKSQLLSWDHRTTAFVFNKLHNMPLMYCGLVIQRLAEMLALVIYATCSWAWKHTNRMEM